MAFFNIIIPTCGRDEELRNALNSIIYQDFTDWRAIVIHDDDKDLDIFPVEDRYYNIIHCYPSEKKGAGGARNIGISMVPRVDDEYTLFLDDDDTLASNDVLGKLFRFIFEKNCPDIVRLGYIKHFKESGVRRLKLPNSREEKIGKIILSPRVGPPTKCIKNSKLVPFRVENCKHQDVVHHIEQCDICETAAVFDKQPYFIYNCYQRPDKDKHSPECQKALDVIPKTLRELELKRPESQQAAKCWARRIEDWYRL